MIIIEGFDATGKTTLIHKLAAEFNLPTVKSYKPKAVEDMVQFHLWASLAPKTAISDRHSMISDLVYGPIIRNFTPSTLELAKHYTKDDFLVYCDPGYERVLATLHNEDQMEGVHNNSLALYKAYGSLMDQLQPHYIYDYSNPRSYRALCQHIQQYLKRS